jgi:hypothetical protein
LCPHWQEWEHTWYASVVEPEWRIIWLKGYFGVHCSGSFDRWLESSLGYGPDGLALKGRGELSDTAPGAAKGGLGPSDEGAKVSLEVLPIVNETIDHDEEVKPDEDGGSGFVGTVRLSPEDLSVLWTSLNSIPFPHPIVAPVVPAEEPIAIRPTHELGHPDSPPAAVQHIDLLPDTEQVWDGSGLEAVDDTLWPPTGAESSFGDVGVADSPQVVDAPPIPTTVAIDSPAGIPEAPPSPAPQPETQDPINADLSKPNSGEIWMLCPWKTDSKGTRCGKVIRSDATAFQTHLEDRHAQDLTRNIRKNGKIRCKGDPKSELKDYCSALPSEMGRHIFEAHLSRNAPNRICQKPGCWRFAQRESESTWCAGCDGSKPKKRQSKVGGKAAVL